MAIRTILDRGSGEKEQRISRARPRMLLVLPAAAAAAALAACGSSGTSASSSTPSSSSAAAAPSAAASAPSASASASAAAAAAGLKTAKVGSVTVLTNAKGFTLYSFAPDTSTTSKCNGPCATSWPPVKPATTSAVKSPFATIKRSDGSTQLTFLGHPLYTFVGDKSTGQATGNGVNAFGGVWHEAPANGGAVPSGGSSSGSGGYQY
jgi:predicted lipoprotein with Yx(FWY)xxD motif